MMTVLYYKCILFEVTVSRTPHPSKNFILSGKDPREDLHNSKTYILLYFCSGPNIAKNARNAHISKSILGTTMDIAGKNLISNFK